jgi:hypothetical protein
MSDNWGGRFRPRKPDSGGRANRGRPDRSGDGRDGGSEEPPTPLAILGFFVVLALVCVGGYFLLMKLISMSRQEDCMLGGGRNCATRIELPSNR